MIESDIEHGTARLTITSAETGLRVGLAGEVDLSNSGSIAAQLAALPRDGHDRVVFDFDGLDYIDSAGLAMIVDIVGRMRRSRSDVSSVALPGTVARRLIDLTGLRELLGVRMEPEPSG